MTLSQLIDILTKAKAIVSGYADDAEVVLHAAEGDAKTVIHSIEAVFSDGANGTATTVTVNHGTAPPAAATSPPAPETDPPADT